MDLFLDLSQRVTPQAKVARDWAVGSDSGWPLPGRCCGGPSCCCWMRCGCFWGAFTSSKWGFHHGKLGKMGIEAWKTWENGDWTMEDVEKWGFSPTTIRSSLAKIGVQAAKILPELVKYLWFYQNTTRTDINQPISQRYRGLKFVVWSRNGSCFAASSSPILFVMRTSRPTQADLDGLALKTCPTFRQSVVVLLKPLIWIYHPQLAKHVTCVAAGKNKMEATNPNVFTFLDYQWKPLQ